MKKFVSKMILALIATALVAGSASAATVYEKDGFKYQIKGDLQVQLRQKIGEDRDLNVDYDDLEIKNRVSYDLGNDLNAFAELDFGFKEAAEGDDDSINFEEAYVGMAYQDYSILVGNTDNAADEFGVFSGYESSIREDAFDAVGATSGNDLIRADLKFADMITVVLSHELEAENEDNGEATSTEIFVGAEFAGFELGLAYQNAEKDVTTDADDLRTWGVSVAYDAKVVWVGADYSATEDELQEYNVAVTVPISKVTLGAGYSYIDVDEDATQTLKSSKGVIADEEASAWYLNATYKFNKNVKVFAEIADNDIEGTDYDMGYLAGMQVKF